MPISQSQGTIGALFLGRGFAQLEGLRIVQIGDQLLRPFSERVNFFDLVQVLQEKIPCSGDARTARINFSNCFSAIRVLLLDCKMRFPWYSVFDVAAVGYHHNFPNALWWS